MRGWLWLLQSGQPQRWTLNNYYIWNVWLQWFCELFLYYLLSKYIISLLEYFMKPSTNLSLFSVFQMIQRMAKARSFEAFHGKILAMDKTSIWFAIIQYLCLCFLLLVRNSDLFSPFNFFCLLSLQLILFYPGTNKRRSRGIKWKKQICVINYCWKQSLYNMCYIISCMIQSILFDLWTCINPSLIFSSLYRSTSSGVYFNLMNTYFWCNTRLLVTIYVDGWILRILFTTTIEDGMESE